MRLIEPGTEPAPGADGSLLPDGPPLVDLPPFVDERPTAVQIELTSRCNLKCKMCPLTSGTSSSSATPGHMPEHIWHRILSSSDSLRHAHLAGFGEPLMNPRWHQMLLDLDRRSISITFVTNGLALSRSVAQKLARLEHLEHVNVSVDSTDPDLYEALRGGRLERTVAGLRNLTSAFPDARRISVSSVLTRETAATLAAVPSLLSELGISNYIVQGLLDYNDFCLDSRPEASTDFHDEMERLRAECARHAVTLHLSVEKRTVAEESARKDEIRKYYSIPRFDETTTRQCTLPWEFPYIDKNGTVFACCNAGASGQEALGSLDEKTVDEVWLDEPYRRFRRRLLDGRTMPAVCRSCTVVPLGPHPLLAFRAAFESGGLDPATGRVRIVYRNLGTEPWTQRDTIFLGTADPRDAPSPLGHPEWIAPNRVGSFAEDSVQPGATATFEFPVVPGDVALAQGFQLVKEGDLWLRGTECRVEVSPPPRRWIRRLRPFLGGRRGPTVSVAAGRDGLVPSALRSG